MAYNNMRFRPMTESQEYRKKYREENKERIKEYQKKYYAKNKKKAKKYYEKNKEQLKEYRKKYYAKNKKKIKNYQEKNKEQLKEYRKKYYAKNKKRIKENGKKYREENKKWIQVYQKKYRKETKTIKELIMKKQHLSLDDITSGYVIEKINNTIEQEIRKIIKKMDMEKIVKTTFQKYIEQENFQKIIVKLINNYFSIFGEMEDEGLDLFDLEEELKVKLKELIKESILSGKCDSQIKKVIDSKLKIKISEWVDYLDSDIIYEAINDKIVEFISKRKVKLV